MGRIVPLAEAAGDMGTQGTSLGTLVCSLRLLFKAGHGASAGRWRRINCRLRPGLSVGLAPVGLFLWPGGSFTTSRE